MNKYKILGQVYTPKWIVNIILKNVGYFGNNILNKKIIDPACGDGAFLKTIVNKYIKTAFKNNYSKENIAKQLENNIFGIEIDKTEHKKTIDNLNNIIAKKLGNIKVNWNIINANTLYKYKGFKHQFDFVVGNPPYIRIHNLDNIIKMYIKKEFRFVKGTIDIYLSFFELGFKLLNKNGMLGYISPNSFLHNSSYIEFREYLKETRAINTLIDFKSNKIFNNFSTYTAITIINFREKNKTFKNKELVNNKIKTINIIKFDDVDKNDWSFSNKKNMSFINKIKTHREDKIKKHFNVQYGFATLKDNIFIGNITKKDNTLVLFNGHLVEKKILAKIVKGSTYKGNKKEIKHIIFPYHKINKRYEIVPEIKLKQLYPNAYAYLLSNKKDLKKRSLDTKTLWYGFGRSQGIQSIHKDKIVISTLVKNKIIFYKLPKEILVYSGIFITKQNKTTNWNVIKNILSSTEFLNFIKLTGKNFSNGYKSITSKQIKEFPIKINE